MRPSIETVASGVPGVPCTTAVEAVDGAAPVVVRSRLAHKPGTASALARAAFAVEQETIAAGSFISPVSSFRLRAGQSPKCWW